MKKVKMFFANFLACIPMMLVFSPVVLAGPENPQAAMNSFKSVFKKFAENCKYIDASIKDMAMVELINKGEIPYTKSEDKEITEEEYKSVKSKVLEDIGKLPEAEIENIKNKVIKREKEIFFEKKIGNCESGSYILHDLLTKLDIEHYILHVSAKEPGKPGHSAILYLNPVTKKYVMADIAQQMMANDMYKNGSEEDRRTIIVNEGYAGCKEHNTGSQWSEIGCASYMNFWSIGGDLDWKNAIIERNDGCTTKFIGFLIHNNSI